MNTYDEGQGQAMAINVSLPKRVDSIQSRVEEYINRLDSINTTLYRCLSGCDPSACGPLSEGKPPEMNKISSPAIAEKAIRFKLEDVNDSLYAIEQGLMRAVELSASLAIVIGLPDRQLFSKELIDPSKVREAVKLENLFGNFVGEEWVDQPAMPVLESSIRKILREEIQSLMAGKAKSLTKAKTANATVQKKTGRKIGKKVATTRKTKN